MMRDERGAGAGRFFIGRGFVQTPGRVDLATRRFSLSSTISKLSMSDE